MLALQGPAHPDQAGVEVDVFPPRAERFALAQAEGQADEPASFHPIALGGLDQLPGLSCRKRDDLVLVRAERVDQAGRVDGDELPLDGHVEGVADHSVDVAQAGA